MHTDPHLITAIALTEGPAETRYFLRLADVLRHIPVSKSTFWSGIKQGRFPRPRHIGRIAVWTGQDIDQLIRDIDGGAL